MTPNRSPLLTLTQAAAYADVCLATIQWHRDFGSLVVIRFDGRAQSIRLAELKRWMAERAAAREQRAMRAAQRRHEAAQRRARWLAAIAARHGLVAPSQAERIARHEAQRIPLAA